MGRGFRWFLASALSAAVVVACGAAPVPPVDVTTTETTSPPESDDPLIAGFAQADRWASAGHPKSGEEAALFDRPYCTVHGRGRHRKNSSCDRPFYPAAVEQPARFARELVARRDAVLSGTVLVNIHEEYGTAAALTIVRELDDDEEMWRAAVFAIAGDIRDPASYAHRAGAPRKIAEEAWRHARAKRTAAARGAALYVFAHLAEPQVSCYSECSDIVDWAHFADWFGERMGPDDLGAFLDVGRNAWHLAYVVAPALGSGWSRARVFIARLAKERADDYETIALGARDAERLLCHEGDDRGLHELAQYLRAGAAGRPPRTGLVASLEQAGRTCRRSR